MAVRGRSLVEQASARLIEMRVDHSVYMAGDKRFNPTKNIQIVSIDTFRSRGVILPADIVVIDEAHYAVSKSFKNFISNYSSAYILAVTATPWVKGGLKHVADELIYPISISELTAQNYLVPAKYFVPTKFDSSKIKTVKGEFNEEDALMEFKTQCVYGDVVKTLEKCRGEPTFCFAINLKHANELNSSFMIDGFKSVVISGETPLDERKFELNRLALGELDVIVSVGTMTTGVDFPPLKNIIHCRPTKSKNLYIQILGRGTRPSAGKDHFKVYDHVGNTQRHGFLIDEQKASLEGEEKKTGKKSTNELSIKTCPECYAAVPSATKKCDCGHEFEVKETTVKESKDHGMIEVGQDVRSRMKVRCEYYLNTAWSKGWKVGAIYMKLKDEFGDEAMRENWQIYRSAKTKWEKWINGTTPAPCQFAVDKFKQQAVYSGFQTDDGNGEDLIW